MVYRWPDWALASLRNIEPYEVMQALAAPRRLPIPAADRAGVRVLTAWARTAAGRPLIVAVRKVEPWSWLIVGAGHVPGRAGGVRPVGGEDAR